MKKKTFVTSQPVAPWEQEGQGITLPVFEPFTTRVRTAYRAPTVESEVKVPFFLSLIVGGFTLVGVMIIMWILALFGIYVPFPVPCAGVSMFCAALVTFLWRVLNHENMTISANEKARRDVQAPAVQVNEPQVTPVQLSVKEKGRSQPTVYLFDLPCTRDRMPEVLDALLAGSSLNESDWAGLRAGRPFSEKRLKDFKAVLVDKRIAAWRNRNNPKLGIKLTELGVQALKQFRDQLADEDVEDAEE